MAEPRKPDSKGLNFLDITDFSPGIYDNSLLAIQSYSTAVSPGVFPAPPGAADANATYGCMSLNNGGLGPLPAQVSTASLTSWGITGLGATEIAGLTNSFSQPDDEMVIAVNTISGGSQTTHLYSYVVNTAILNSIVTGTYTYSAHANFVAYPFTTTITNGGGNPQPVVVMGVCSPDGPLRGDLWLYPSVAAPTAFGADDVATHQGGPTFAHQGRIAMLVTSPYSWPNAAGVRAAPDPLSYTDPPQTETWPNQFETFGPENPFGYGAVNSVSAGELFLVKSRGGGLIIQGDLNNPTVTTLNGVKSTGAIYGKTGTDANGMYYCVENEGAWVWNGGNASQKVSTQLDDNFFAIQDGSNANLSPYYWYSAQRWGGWMMFSNNWMLNSQTGAWWRLDNPSNQRWFWYVPGYHPNVLFTALPVVTGSGQVFFAKYDATVPRASYVWQSLPIRLPTEDRLSDVREIVVRASNPYGDTGPQIVPAVIANLGPSQGLDTWAMTHPGGEVQETRFNCSVKGETIAVNLTCTGNSFAPVIHSISIGYRTREHSLQT